jgi:hypothetical protein
MGKITFFLVEGRIIMSKCKGGLVDKPHRKGWSDNKNNGI